MKHVNEGKDDWSLPILSNEELVLGEEFVYRNSLLVSPRQSSIYVIMIVACVMDHDICPSAAYRDF